MGYTARMKAQKAELAQARQREWEDCPRRFSPYIGLYWQMCGTPPVPPSVVLLPSLHSQVLVPGELLVRLQHHRLSGLT